ncbi:hypothetical protein HZR84_06315 [Hyphobacterium sp. CCMP332]|nr:hypothetical protein HZR84_06315 [Hyphobacterium sp. CCMP332]
MKTLIYILFSLVLVSCTNGEAGSNKENSPSSGISTVDMNYWYQGKAELSSYDLKQSRYGEIHKGHSVLIFVSEPFNTEKQVKADRPASSPGTNVLKLNFTKKFSTGIYPYSLMTSVFTPINQNEYPNTLKVSTTNQDWCGHTFMQLNLDKDKYRIEQFSYFESEGDKQIEIKKVLLEDEIWNLIRLQGGNLPVGKMSIYPSTQYLRLKHKENKVFEVNARLEKDKGINTYTLEYKNRILSIEFENKEPFKILGWTETYLNNGGAETENLTTTATLKETILLDYWNKNSVADSVYRAKLGLN